MYRTKNLGELRIENVGEEVELAGWVQKVRNLGGMIFIDLRDQYGTTQIVVNEENLQKLTVLTLNIIFCFNGEYHKSKKYANDPFYNPGGVVTEFKEVIRFLKKDNNISSIPNIVKEK